MRDSPLLLPLASGDLSADDAAELEQLKQFIADVSGFVPNNYKDKCIRRRIAVRMRARAVHRYGDYLHLLNGDAAEVTRLIDALTINVSKFYRNPAIWKYLREKVLPVLAETRGRVRVWSAGCASGEEPYTVAIEVKRYAEEHGDSASRFDIVGTDVDADSLLNAKRGLYSDYAMTETPPEVIERFFVRKSGFELAPEIRSMVRFDTLNLMNDPYPSDQHLIICRNVIIYFHRPVQETIFAGFHAALAPGGFLFLGKVETLFGHIARSFTPVSARDRIFRRA